MITRIEMDGFKTFQDFRLELAPFQVIIGANGAGKSNLFDALRLLAHLAESDLRAAFQAVRGESGELFTILSMSTRVQPKSNVAPLRITRIRPVMAGRQLQMDLGIDERERQYTLGEVVAYLESADPGEAQAQLRGNQKR